MSNRIEGSVEASIYSCQGKARYDGAKDALNSLKRLQKRGQKPGGAYRCSVCGGYHLGHSRAAKKPVKFHFNDGSE